MPTKNTTEFQEQIARLGNALGLEGEIEVTEPISKKTWPSISRFVNKDMIHYTGLRYPKHRKGKCIMFFKKKAPKPAKKSFLASLFGGGGEDYDRKTKKKNRKHKEEAYWDDCETNLPPSSAENEWAQKDK